MTGALQSLLKFLLTALLLAALVRPALAFSLKDQAYLIVEVDIDPSCEFKAKGETTKWIDDLTSNWKADFKGEIDCNVAWRLEFRPEHGFLSRISGSGPPGSNDDQVNVLYEVELKFGKDGPDNENYSPDDLLACAANGCMIEHDEETDKKIKVDIKIDHSGHDHPQPGVYGDIMRFTIYPAE